MTEQLSPLEHCPLDSHCQQSPRILCTACVLRAPRQLSPSGLRRTPGQTPFHPKHTLFCGVTFLRVHPLPATPFQCPRSRTATIGLGAATPFLPLRWPDCTLSGLRAEEYDPPATQSRATPEPSSRTIPTLDRTLVAR